MYVLYDVDQHHPHEHFKRVLKHRLQIATVVDCLHHARNGHIECLFHRRWPTGLDGLLIEVGQELLGLLLVDFDIPVRRIDEVVYGEGPKISSISSIS